MFQFVITSREKKKVINLTGVKKKLTRSSTRIVNSSKGQREGKKKGLGHESTGERKKGGGVSPTKGTDLQKS